MRIQRAFLNSRAGRRIFWTLLLAAAVPIGLFGYALHTLLSEHFEAQTQRQQVQLIKFAGMSLLERLLVARTSFAIATRPGGFDPDAMHGDRRGRAPLRIARLDAQGRLVDGDAGLAMRWSESHAEAAHAGAATTLALGAFDAASGMRPVWMSLDRGGERWIGEIDPVFLFGELTQEANGARICVFQPTRGVVFCPGDTQEWVTQAAQLPSWNLFLRSDFGVDDWTLVSMDAAGSADSTELPLARLAALGAAVTLAFVSMLSLIQVRRTMVPLERLIDGTRRLAERDYGVRLPVATHDEFGELARSFNHMAERIGGQVQALHVQSSIDHEILNGLNVARVLQRVAQRLEQLVPGACATVVEMDRSSRLLARVHNAHDPFALTAITRADLVGIGMAGGDLVLCEQPPSWLRCAQPKASSFIWLHCARAGDEVLGLLVIGTDDGRPIDQPDTRREIAELADRVSVTLASADRERRLLERATSDSLTGLANRAGLYEGLEQRLGDPLRPPFTLMYIDLDRFKELNDSMGHQAGDELLRAIAQRLRRCVPEGTLVARPGGDEFVLLLNGLRGAADELSPRLCVALSMAVPVAGRNVSVGASIGMAHHPEHGVTASDLMRRADMAMYRAKANGGGTADWFDAELDQRMAERTALLADLRHALGRGEFQLHYQPRIGVRSRALVGAEALLRWSHPERGLVPVPVFVELLEETGLIDAVGLWAIEQACSQLARWRASAVPLDAIAVNVSTRQLRDVALPDQVAAILARHGLQPQHLELEVTESSFMGDCAAAIDTLQRLHDSGIGIALDDFGTGYSSLSYLHKLPIGVLKVDRSFVNALGERDSALALTRSIIALARALDLRVVAEGVETERQAGLLIELGCDELQGFLYAPALEPAAFARFASERDAMRLITA